MPDSCQIPAHKMNIRRSYCIDCASETRRSEAVAKFKEGCRNQIYEILVRSGGGLQRIEAMAEPSKIPTSILHALPHEFRDGSLSVGFGLGGGTGIGKTQAIAAMLIKAMFHYANHIIIPSINPDLNSMRGFPSIRWACWPDELHWLRSNAIHGATERVEGLAMVQLLVLDDLGRERIKGGYTEDYGASQLDFIVNSRYRSGLPTIWTTNVREADLVGLYGAAMFRRLNEPNPLNWVDGLKPFHHPPTAR